MPIDKTEFKAGTDGIAKILDVFVKNPNTAYTRLDIQKETGLSAYNVAEGLLYLTRNARKIKSKFIARRFYYIYDRTRW